MKTDKYSPNNGKDTKGRFLPGNPGKPHGSSKNKLRDEIRTFLNENWKDFPTWFKALKPKEKIDTMLDLMPYAVSRLQSVAMTDSDGNDLPEKKAIIDYTKLSSKALSEILKHTQTNEAEL
ncbi:MAG: hypothetical protein DYG99_09080 [Bacteroidetes bacterium CHB5]|nr:hypothetical protein [Bacteroidetes bacterium CHB5]